jgi:hypothetical protein
MMEVFDDLRAKLRNLERKAVRSPTMSPAAIVLDKKTTIKSNCE